MVVGPDGEICGHAQEEAHTPLTLKHRRGCTGTAGSRPSLHREGMSLCSVLVQTLMVETIRAFYTVSYGSILCKNHNILYNCYYFFLGFVTFSVKSSAIQGS